MLMMERVTIAAMCCLSTLAVMAQVVAEPGDLLEGMMATRVKPDEAALNAATRGLSFTPERLRAPAEFRVLDTVLTPNPGPYAATFGDGPINVWINASYEPIVMRRKFHAAGESPNELILPRSEIDGYNVWKSGLWDGARARVYRVRNGRLVKVREDVVAQHHASGWHRLGGFPADKLLPRETSTFQFRVADWSRRGVPYYFCLRSVGADGRESGDSKVVSVVVPHERGAATVLPPDTIAFAPDKSVKSAAGPPPPANLQGSVDPASGVITLTWEVPGAGADDVDALEALEGIGSAAVASARRGIMGYRPYGSDYPPEEHKGFRILLASSPGDPRLHVKAGDMVFLEKTLRTWDRGRRYSNRVYGSHEGTDPAMIPFTNGPDPSRSWRFVEHPGPIPEAFADRGQTCLEMKLGNTDPVELGIYKYAGTDQNWYGVLDPGKTYVVEFWGRTAGAGQTPVTATFQLTGPLGGDVKPMAFALTDAWHRHTATFRVPRLLTAGGPVGKMVMRFEGQGMVWFDNYRVYEAGTDFLDFSPGDYAALEASALGALRTHGHIKTGWGYTMAMLTNPPGVTGYSGVRPLSPHTLDSWFSIFAKAKVNPWIQVEMCMDETEWLGFVEYLAAPFDPATDTPGDKPWAYKRAGQGREAPWIAAFSKFYFEISNETWNPLFRPWVFNWLNMPDEATGRVYQSGEIYGLFQEYVMEVMRGSPYWTAELEAKFEAVVGGWAIQTGDNGYGQQAARLSPGSRHITVGAYNGGWDEKERPAEATDAFYFKALAQTVQVAIPRADALAEWLVEHRQTHGGNQVLGTYEAGPGYNLNGLNGVRMTRAQTESESRVMKSLAGGTATLDSFLARGERGFVLQNFFTFGRRRHHWHSHARWTRGGQAYPCWKALSLYNREGTGDFLKTETIGVPTLDFLKKGRRQAAPNAPLIAVYATRTEKRVNLFVLSRRLDNFPVAGDDGFTPVTVRLPFGEVKSVTLHRMTGNPRDHNLDADLVKVETVQIPVDAFSPAFVVGARTGADARGLPPAATFLYVFRLEH